MIVLNWKGLIIYLKYRFKLSLQIIDKSGNTAVAFIILLAAGDKDIVIISFDNAWHLRYISLCKLNLVYTKVKFFRFLRMNSIQRLS